ncbi:DUF3160 domain-containing protein [Butyrivibrio sp. XBB1001]|uniref:DUF3160 domain-containing protein n=1 Tax=Butyrivibrio sp. XBB1001 TaxID=1280682 RepID=UPI00040E4D2B|nr:DUF3160 domain-containing protein [Butyrivibrio sp. XBB1001]
MKKRVLAMLLAVTMVTGCSLTPKEPDTSADAENSETVSSTDVSTGNEKEDETKTDTEVVPVSTSGRTSLLGGEEVIYYDPDLVPSVPGYSVNPDFSNVVYNDNQKWTLDLEYQSEYNDVQSLRNALIEKNFAVVHDGGYSEFFDVYEGNRYSQLPSFVTVDSLMHTYHLYFAYLMKHSEKDYLSGELQKLSTAMLENSKNQYEALKGSDWESAALRNLEFFFIGNKLLDESVAAPISDSSFDSVVNDEYNKIMSAEGIAVCSLTSLNEDYSQYKPRGYYEGDEILEKYFRAMMWYGRIPYALDNEDMVKSAILQTIAISESGNSWESIYKITSFFAGASDDPGYTEMSDIVTLSYGAGADVSKLADNKDAFDKVLAAVKELKIPEINSIPVKDGDDPIIPSFRFMGQRFTIDAAIMQRLVYSSVEENSNGDRRYLPDALDTPAALGSETALEILTDQGATDYKNYTDNLTIVSDKFNNSDPKFWNASLYAGWLNTLRPLLEEKGEGYPSYMTSKEWTKKNLETFTGSFAELKHDTILYAKQVMAEMGDGEQEILDDRGYVDPQPVVYSRFKFLSEKTKEGLEGYGMLSDSGKEDLDKLSEIAGTLLSISEKELKNEALSDEDYEFIRCYGGYIEHFWSEVNEENFDEALVYSYQAPCPIIADIATDPNGTVLEVGTGEADAVYVVFPIDGELHVGKGSVYSFYQFETGISDRLTDSQWRGMLAGGYYDDDYNWIEVENPITQPEWTQSYRIGKK